MAPYLAAFDQAQQALIQRAQQFGSDLKSAVQEATQAIGTVDLAKGFQSIADAAPGLDRARDALRGLGQESSALDRLAQMADEWKAITDAEDKATAAFRGYLQLYGETDQRIQQLQALKQNYDAAADAARKAQQQGLPLNAAQRDVLANQGAVDANIDAAINKLRGGQAADLTAAVKLAPDFATADAQMRDWVLQHGGPQALALGVKADTEQAQKDIQSFLDQPRQMLIKVALDTSGLPTWAVSFLDRAGGGNMGGATAAAGGRTSVLDTVVNSGQGGGGLGYRDLSKSQYSSIVTSGPLANAGAYAQLVKAAQAAGIDPRILLATLKYEGQFGTDPNLAAASVNNYSGIKYANQPGAYDSGIRADNGGTYAGFDSLTEFFAALAKNLSTGIYESLFKTGDFRAIATRYVAGYAQPTMAQESNINNRVGYYEGLNQQYPAQGGGGQDVAQSTVNSVRQKIVAKAMESLDTDHLAELCEQFVEETIESITGRRGATGQREQSAASALQNALGQGLGVSRAQAQPGDLVYYGGTAGNPNGHVAIYMGNGQQISTEDVGGSKVHIENVLPGAQFVRVPGLPDEPAALLVA